MHLSCIVTEIWGPKYNRVTTLTFWGHMTSSVTWPSDPAWALSYWWSMMTMRLSCTDTEIRGFKDFGVTSLTFWGHVTSSVTWPLDLAHVVFYWWSIGTMRLSCTGGQNNHIIGIPEAILPIHYKTFMGLRWRLVAVYRWNFYTGAFLAENLSVFCPIFDFGGIF